VSRSDINRWDSLIGLGPALSGLDSSMILELNDKISSENAPVEVRVHSRSLLQAPSPVSGTMQSWAHNDRETPTRHARQIGPLYIELHLHNQAPSSQAPSGLSDAVTISNHTGSAISVFAFHLAASDTYRIEFPKNETQVGSNKLKRWEFPFTVRSCHTSTATTVLFRVTTKRDSRPLYYFLRLDISP